MNILMIAPEPFFEPRGTPISVYDRLIGLSRLGHQVDLLTYHIGQEVKIPGVRIHRIPSIPYIHRVRVGPSWEKLLLDIFLFLKAIQMLKDNKYDVIHSHEEAAFFSIFLSKLFSTKHLYDMHSSLSKQLTTSKYGYLFPAVCLFDWLERAVFKSCDALITIACDLYTLAENINPGINQMLIENMASGVARSISSPDLSTQLKTNLNLNGKVPIVYTGTLEAYQGIEMLLESASMVRSNYPHVAFIIVGGQPDQVKALQHKARQHNVGDCTYFTGAVSFEEALAYLDIAEVLVSPRIQGLSVPLKIYNYMHSGKPIVATRLPAHTQVLDDEIACLVEINPEAFAEGILSLIVDPERGAYLGDKAAKHARERQSFDEYLSKIELIYSTLENTPADLYIPA